MSAVQLPHDVRAGLLPLDPRELLAPERGRLYSELGLDSPQREAAEEAVRLIQVGRYGGARK